MRRTVRLVTTWFVLPVSLVVGAAALVFWARGYRVRDTVRHTWSDPADKSAGTLQVSSSRGRIRVERQREDWADPAGIVTLGRGSDWAWVRTTPTPLELSPDDADDGMKTGQVLGVAYATQRFTSPYRGEDPSQPAGRTQRVAIQAWRHTQVVVPAAYGVALAAVPWVVLLWRGYRRQRSRTRLLRFVGAAATATALAIVGGVT